MSAPKPRVSKRNGRWRVECSACRIAGWETTWRRTMRMAMQHSRTHTAQRVADHLTALADDALDDQDYGRAGAFGKAALIVRKHLVNA